MKRLLITFASTLLSLPVFAGITYDFRSTTSGMREGSLAGTVSADGSNMRMDLKSGDNFLFKDNAVILSTDGGKTLTVFDPAAKTYYSININELAQQPGAALASMGGSVKFQNPKVSVKDLGAAETLSGFPTHHAIVDASYDIAIDMMGNQMTSHMTMTTESWTTDQIRHEFANFIQEKNLHTGFADLDKLLEAQAAAIEGRFPLKQVTTLHVQQGTADLTSTTTSEVFNVATHTVPASLFTASGGYTKVDDPLSRMLKNLK